MESIFASNANVGTITNAFSLQCRMGTDVTVSVPTEQKYTNTLDGCLQSTITIDAILIFLRCNFLLDIEDLLIHLELKYMNYVHACVLLRDDELNGLHDAHSLSHYTL